VPHAVVFGRSFSCIKFARIHQTLRVTPAMAAGVTKRLWEMADIVDVLEAWENSAH
jgi:hypothetical protein